MEKFEMKGYHGYRHDIRISQNPGRDKILVQICQQFVSDAVFQNEKNK